MAEPAKNPLPDDVDALKLLLSERDRDLEEHKQVLSQRERKIAFLEEYIRHLKLKRFAKSSERFVDDVQTSLFNEAEQLADAAPESGPESGEAAPAEPLQAEPASDDNDAPVKPRARRQKLPEHLPRFKVVHELPAEARHCSCGCSLEAFDEVRSEQLGIIPAQLYVIQHCRKKYRCSRCPEQAPVTAPLPAQPFPKSNASPELMAEVTVSKFLDGLPFYRQEQIWKRQEIDLPRATLARWSIQAGKAVQPLINLYRDQQRQAGVMHIDETPVPVLKEPGKPPDGKKHFWVTASGPPDKPIYVFHYDPSRGSAVADALLEDFQGTVISDDWSVYARVCQARGLAHIACNDHARRKFDEALKLEPKQKAGKVSKAAMAMNFYKKLYAVERKIKNCSAEEKYQARQRDSVPIWEKFIGWIEESLPKVTPESKLGKALNYTYRLRDKLRAYCNDGHLPISNQLAENAIRPFAIARKNFLFFDTPQGASASANLYSLIMTSKSHGLDPFYYLAYAFKHLPQAKTVEEVERLLPWKLSNEQIKEGFGCQ